MPKVQGMGGVLDWRLAMWPHTQGQGRGVTLETVDT